MSKLGDDVYEWNVEKLMSWLQAEGLNDCVKTFVMKKIDGCKLLNLSEDEIKSLHVSVESKRKLLKAVERVHKRKKEKLAKMFGDNVQAQRVVAKRPTSISNDEVSDDEGWDSDEFDPGSDGGESSSDCGGEYLEPEGDFSKPKVEKRSYERECAPIQSGLVAQLKQGIAQSLMRNAAPSQEDDFEDEDLYDVPPEEEDLYEEPSDSSGGAVVIRPPPKPPRGDDDSEYLLMKGDDQDMYEAPIEGEDISQSPASQQNNFIPTKVLQDNAFESVPNKNDNTETYEVPVLSDDEDELNYEIPDTGVEAPPPRPPKNNNKPAPQTLPSWTPQKTAPLNISRADKPLPQEISMTQPKRTLSKHGSPFQLPQGSPVRHPKPNALPNRPGTTPKQLSPSHSAKPSALSPQKSPTHHLKPNTQTPPLQQKSTPSQPKLPPHVSEEKKPTLTPKLSPRPRPVADPTKRGPAPPPAHEAPKKTGPPPGNPNRSSAPISPPENHPNRKFSGPKSSPPHSPKKTTSEADFANARKSPLPVPSGTGERHAPRPSPRGGLLSQRDSLCAPGPDLPQKSTPGPPIPSGRQPQLFRETHERPTPVKPVAAEFTPPPRPPKHGSPAQPSLPSRQGLKSSPLPVPPPDKKSAPLPPPPTEKRTAPPPPVNSHSSFSSSKEQSSASSIESSSADEPIASFGQRKKPPQTRGLPQLPPTPQSKSPLEVMKGAPWFHGPVDRKKSEVNLRSTNLDGAFLVRNSTKNPNDYSMSLFCKGNIRHLKLPKKNGQYVLGDSGVQKFDSIMDLISYYRQHEVDLASGGKTKLTAHAQNIAR